MSLQIGIVGLPNVGKSTLFNALTRAGATVASYPFTTIDPNLGVVEVPDRRLADIATIVKPKEVKPTTIEFVDIAGLVKGAHQGEGLGNQFLGHIRNVDAVALVVRCFEDPDVAHVTAELDPTADSDVIDLELQRLDAMMAGIWNDAVSGKAHAIDRVLKIMERRAKLLNLDKGIDAQSVLSRLMQGLTQIRHNAGPSQVLCGEPPGEPAPHCNLLSCEGGEDE